MGVDSWSTIHTCAVDAGDFPGRHTFRHTFIGTRQKTPLLVAEMNAASQSLNTIPTSSSPVRRVDSVGRVNVRLCHA